MFEVEDDNFVPEMDIAQPQGTLAGASSRRKMGWGQGAVLFQCQKNNKLAGSPAQDAQLVMAADFSPEAINFILQFNITGIDGVPVRCQATVSWMVEGTQVSRRFDVVNGATFYGTGQSVRVLCVDITDPAADFPNATGNNYVVSVQCCPGTRPSQNQPPTLFGGYFAAIGPGAGVDVPVPSSAGVISCMVLVATGVAGQNSVVFVKYHSGTVVMAEFDPTLQIGFIPMTPSTTTVTITNLATVEGHTLNVTVIWGIDG